MNIICIGLLLLIHTFISPADHIAAIVKSACRSYQMQSDINSKLALFGATNDDFDDTKSPDRSEEENSKNVANDMNQKNPSSSTKKKFMNRVWHYIEAGLEIINRTGPDEIGDFKSPYTIKRIEKMLEWKKTYGNYLVDKLLEEHLTCAKEVQNLLNKNNPAIDSTSVVTSTTSTSSSLNLSEKN